MTGARRQRAGAAAVAAALDAGEPMRLVMVREGELSATARDVLARCRDEGVPILTAGAREMKRKAADGEPDLLALVGPDPGASLDDVLAGGGALWLLTGVAYPGNAGFAIRTAEVSGAAAIALDASFGHDGRRQALRTSMRADRLFPVLWARGEDVVERARAAKVRVLGIECHGTASIWETDLTGPVLFVVGGEAGGVPPAILGGCDASVRLPMAGFIPSYNLQAAVAMVAGERLRQTSA